MARTLANSIIIAIGVAIALSFLPSVEMTSTGEVSVFRREHSAPLTEETLVDFLVVQQSQFAYRHVEWDKQSRTLQIDFTASEPVTKADIAKDWLPFTQNAFQTASNIEALHCRLYLREDDMLLSVLKVARDDLEKQKLANGVKRDEAAEYMEENFYFHMQ